MNMQIAHLPMTQFWSTDSALRERPSPLDNLDVAVHEYANSTSAHDTVLEHRFSPTRTPFTSWQYANERGQG